MSGDCRGGGVQKERARAAACFIVRLAGGHDDSGPIAGKDDYFQQLDGRFDRARDAPDRRIFATKDPALPAARKGRGLARSEEQTSELQSLMRSSYAVFCLTKKKQVE